MRKQDLGRVVRSEAGYVFGHKVLAQRPVDEPPRDPPGVDVGRADRGSHVIECFLTDLVQPGRFGIDVVSPVPDAGEGMAGCARPGPGTERGQAGAWVRLAVAATAHAQSPGGTLAKIRETGEIKLGHRDVSVPFSYLDDNQKPVGFAMDLCGRIVDAVKEELKLPSIQTRLQPIQLSTQIPLIQNGTIDIVCGPATNTLERQKVVAFSNTIFVSSIRAVVRKDGPIKTFEDMTNKPVSLTAGSTSIALLATHAQEKNFQTQNILSGDHAASFLALTTGRRDAAAGPVRCPVPAVTSDGVPSTASRNCA